MVIIANSNQKADLFFPQRVFLGGIVRFSGWAAGQADPFAEIGSFGCRFDRLDLDAEFLVGLQGQRLVRNNDLPIEMGLTLPWCSDDSRNAATVPA
jgi:hypothetical protein